MQYGSRYSRKNVTKNSPKASLAKAAANEIVAKGSRSAIYRNSSRTELIVRKSRKSTLLLMKGLLVCVVSRLLLVIISKEKDSNVPRSKAESARTK